MPNYNKVVASTGLSRKNNRLNLGGFMVNSLDFGRYKLLGAFDMQPSDKFNINFSHVLKMTPLVGHTLGKCQLDVKSFFVPYRLAYKYFEEFQRGVSVVASNTFNPQLPKVTNAELTMYFSMLNRCGFRSSPVDDVSDNNPWSASSDYTLVNPFVRNFKPENALCEIVGSCIGVNASNGEPFGVLKYGALGTGHLYAYLPDSSSNDYLPGYGYTGKDFDIIAPLYGDIDLDGGGFCMEYMPFQAYGTYLCDESGTPLKTTTLQHRPYVLLRFTALGKRLFDFFNTLGYGLNFGSPYYWSDQIVQSAFPIVNSFGTTDSAKSRLDYLYFPDEQQIDGDPDAWKGCIPDTHGVYEGSFPLVTSLHAPDASADYWFVEKGSGFDNTPINLLKLLSWFKVYADFLCPSYWVRDFEVEVNSFFFGTFTLDKLFDVLSRTLVSSYDKDYFTSAWTTPNQPTEQSFNGSVTSTDSSIPNDDPDHFDNHVNSDDSGTVLSGNVSKVTIDIVNALHKLARISGLSGTRYIDQLFARFGVKNSNARLQRAEMLDEMRSSFQVDTVMSNASTDDASLGDYTAHGHSENSGSLGYGEITEFGVILVFANITPLTCYYQGRVRQNTYTNKDDFYSPELDEVDATQSVRMDELYSDNRYGPLLFTAQNDGVYNPNGTFGYTRLFGETKHGRDMIGGDFRLDSRGKYTNQAYHLFRDMPSLHDLIYNSTPLVNSLNFNMAYDNSQYERIFQLVNGDYDHFYLFANLDVNVTRKNKPITDYSYEDECEKVKRSLHNGGTELN